MQPNNNVLIVDARHNGPPGSGNGGWTSGLIAAHVGAHVTGGGVPEVTLRKPPPLQTPLTVITTELLGRGASPRGKHAPLGAAWPEEGLRVVDPDGTVIATARSRQEEIAPVPPVARDVAAEAMDRYPGHGEHHFPTCFVCGPQRLDGLRVFPGRLADGRTAAIFTVPDDIEAVTVWAALDCPGGWTVIEGDRPWVLGRLAVAIDELPKSGEECVVVGQAVSREGRKALIRTTLYAERGRSLARGEATWIQLGL